MSLFAELKRRNVFKVGAAYLALGWVVTEVSNTVVPLLHLPESIPAILLWIGLAGFPFVIIFSWAYEITPEGIKRECEVDRSESITHVTVKRLDYIIIALLAVAIGLFLLQYLRPPATQPIAKGDVTGTPAAPVAEVAAPVPAAPALEPAAVPPNDKSIAVLPFVNMSSDKEQEYFSDGISEELLNLLAKIPELKVIARTSSFAFKGKEVDIADIAAKLKVAHVLEGSVRKSGNKIRITTQLIRAADSVHLWSETYDRPLDDIFAVQDEIAGAVVEQLKVKLLGAVPKVRQTSPEAYALYLQALQSLRQGTRAGTEQSIVLFQQALAIDPTYTPAWDWLGVAYAAQANVGAARSADESFRLAREASGKALDIDPNFAPAHGSLGWIALVYEDDLVAAAAHLGRALALDPADHLITGTAAELVASLGRLNTAVGLGEYIATRDPFDPNLHSNVSVLYYWAGHLDKTIMFGRYNLTLTPDAEHAHYRIGVALLLKGEIEEALQEMQAEPGEGWRQTGLALAYHALGRKADSDAALAELIEKHQKSWSSSIAWVLAYRGEPDRAFEWLDKAVANHDTGVAHFPIEPLLANLHSDPRWLPFLRKIGKAPEQLAAIKFDVMVPQQ